MLPCHLQAILFGFSLCNENVHLNPLELAHISLKLAALLFIMSGHLFIFSRITFLKNFHPFTKVLLLPFLLLVKKLRSLFGIRTSLLSHLIWKLLCILLCSLLSLLCQNLNPSSFLRLASPDARIFPRASSHH